MSKRTRLVVGNWKMNLDTTDAIKLITELKSKMVASEGVEVVVAPPFTALSSVEIAIQESSIKLGAQNCYFEEDGAFTGEISVPMLLDIGCQFVLIGHSERRRIFNETNDWIAKKAKMAVQSEMVGIVCVGETAEQRAAGSTQLTIEEQVLKGLGHLTHEDMAHVVMAYEPVWAIGTGKTATPANAQEVHQHIRNLISKKFDKPIANQVRILYGGSVNGQNARDLLKEPDIDGLLVGGASLDSTEFAKIIGVAAEV